MTNFLLLTRGTRKPDCTGLCLYTTDESEKVKHYTFCSNL